MKQSTSKFAQSAAILGLLYLSTLTVFYMAYTTEYSPKDHFGSVRLCILILLAPIILKYVIQLIASPFYTLVENYRERRGDKVNLIKPLVSVLIPAWNEEVGILKTIQSVLNTNYQNLEVIVINDGSTDGTDSLVREFIKSVLSSIKGESEKKTRSNIKYLSVVNGGKAKALNRGLEVASGEFVLTVDADCIVDKHAVDKILKRFTNKNVAAVAGNVVVGNRQKPIEVIQQLEYLYGFFFKRADSTFNSVYIIGGAAAAYRKSTLQELGGFDEEIITEDIEMSTRILAQGYKTRYAADAVIYTEGPSDFKGLCSQRLRWKFGRILTFIKHKNLFFSSHKKHNPYLTFLILPVAVYAEITLLFESVILAFFYGYTIYANDYLPLVFVVLFMSMIIVVQILFDSKSKFHRNLFALAPVAWLVFYFIDVVEFQALCRSLKRYFKRENLEWQKWARVGLLNHSVTEQTILKSITQTEMPVLVEGEHY